MPPRGASGLVGEKNVWLATRTHLEDTETKSYLSTLAHTPRIYPQAFPSP